MSPRELLSSAAFLLLCAATYTLLGFTAEAAGQDWTHVWELNLR